MWVHYLWRVPLCPALAARPRRDLDLRDRRPTLESGWVPVVTGAQGYLPVPAPAGKKTAVTFHLDAGVGLNAASGHPTEGRTFLTWLTTSEAATLLGNELPGFYPMHRAPPVLLDPHARAFLEWNARYPTDVRFSWERISEGQPSAYDLIMELTIAVWNGERSPGEAAAALQRGLASWYVPRPLPTPKGSP